jgi:hypothetical protein
MLLLRRLLSLEYTLLVCIPSLLAVSFLQLHLFVNEEFLVHRKVGEGEGAKMGKGDVLFSSRPQSLRLPSRIGRRIVSIQSAL